MTTTVRNDRSATVAPRDPWFRQRPLLALVTAGVLFAGVLTLRLLVGQADDAYSMLDVLPVALVAAGFGMRAGVAAGLLAVLLIAVWALARDVSLTPLGWASRVTPMLLLGGLLGYATDRMRAAELQRRQAQAAALLHREAIEINDSLVQGMAAAKWSLEAGQVEAGLETLDHTMAQAQELVSGLIRQARMGGHAEQLP